MNRSRTLTLGAAAGAALAIVGCASRPPLAVQRFVLDVPSGPLPTPSADARVVALPPVRMNPAFLEPSLVYRIGPDAVEVDHYASLAAPPRSMLTTAIRAYLLRLPFAKDVVPGLAGPKGLTVEVVVQELSGDFRSASAPVGALDLEVIVYSGDPAPGAAPAFRRLYSRREPLAERTAAAVVASWNRALRSILEELGDDLRGLAGATAPSPPGAGGG